MLRIGVSVCGFFLLFGGSAQSGEAPVLGRRVAIQWAFGALPAGGGELRAMGRESVLKTGDRLKMMVQLDKTGYVYVLHQDAGEEITLLFPNGLEQFDSDYRIGQAYYVPRGEDWYELDGKTGREVFTLIVSPERLTDLEKLYTCYASSQGEQRGEWKKRLQDEIRALKKQQLELAAPAERPVTIGGTVRGLQKPLVKERPDVASIANPIQSDGIVVKVFSIDHR